MPLDLLSPPAEALASIQAITPLLREHPGINAHMPGVAEVFAHIEQKASAEPLLSVPVYILGADAIVAGGDLSTLKPALWSHFLSPAKAPIGRLMTADTGLESSQVESIFEGPAAADFAQELEVLKAEPHVQKGDFELAELRVPSAHVVALWLKDRKGHGDILVPYAGHPDALERGRRYSAKDFLDALRPAAEAAQQSAQRPDDSGPKGN